MSVEPYGTSIQEAVASGDLERMKAVAKQAEAYLLKVGDVSGSLAALKVEIAKLEKRGH
jgi:monomeric isocitrate dehydrogenase